MNPIVKSFEYGQHTVTLETGVIARQADAAVLASMGDTTVLVTVVGKKEADPSRDFFPLTVNYQEKTYAAGKIPGGFFKREGRPSEDETLIARLIDRPIRPLFPDGFTNEVQVIITVVSVDPQIEPDIVAMIGTSAALAISGIPFNGPLGAARVGYINGEYVLNPGAELRENSQLDLVVAGTQSAVLMVESEAKALPEEVMLGAWYTVTSSSRWWLMPSMNSRPKPVSLLGTGQLLLPTKSWLPRLRRWPKKVLPPLTRSSPSMSVAMR